MSGEQVPRRANAVTMRAIAATTPATGAIGVGFAQLQTGDSLGALIARADASLYEARER